MDEDQERCLDDAKKVIKDQAYFMEKVRKKNCYKYG
jgi:hypothetical protein